jgi:hypothetical protein
VRIFREIKVRTVEENIGFYRRVGRKAETEADGHRDLYRGQSKPPGSAKELQNSTYSGVNIGTDLRKKQRSEELNMRDKVDNRNKDLSRDDQEKILKWLVVGRRRGRRIIKGQDQVEAASQPARDRRKGRAIGKRGQTEMNGLREVQTRWKKRDMGGETQRDGMAERRRHRPEQGRRREEPGSEREKDGREIGMKGVDQ